MSISVGLAKYGQLFKDTQFGFCINNCVPKLSTAANTDLRNASFIYIMIFYHLSNI